MTLEEEIKAQSLGACWHSQLALGGTHRPRVMPVPQEGGGPHSADPVLSHPRLSRTVFPATWGAGDRETSICWWGHRGHPRGLQKSLPLRNWKAQGSRAPTSTELGTEALCCPRAPRHNLRGSWYLFLDSGKRHQPQGWQNTG